MKGFQVVENLRIEHLSFSFSSFDPPPVFLLWFFHGFMDEKLLYKICLMSACCFSKVWLLKRKENFESLFFFRVLKVDLSM